MGTHRDRHSKPPTFEPCHHGRRRNGELRRACGLRRTPMPAACHCHDGRANDSTGTRENAGRVRSFDAPALENSGTWERADRKERIHWAAFRPTYDFILSNWSPSGADERPKAESVLRQSWLAVGPYSVLPSVLR
jgi:hypothetical protein